MPKNTRIKSGCLSQIEPNRFETSSNFPSSQTECLKAFEAERKEREGSEGGLSIAKVPFPDSKYNPNTLHLKIQIQPNLSCSPSGGREGEKKQKQIHKQYTLKLK